MKRFTTIIVFLITCSLSACGQTIKQKQVEGLSDSLAARQFIENRTVYVDTSGSDATGVVGNKNRPYKTIDAALVATSSLANITIRIGMGSFTAPSLSNSRNDIAIIGSGQPRFDTNPTVVSFDSVTQTLPTKLVGGTIIRGTMNFADKSNIHFENFGVDVGTDWKTNVNSGTPSDGILIAQNYTAGGADGFHPTQESHPPTTNTIIRNITVLGSGDVNYHGLLVENKSSAIVENITSARFGYCIVFKTHNLVANNLVIFAPQQAGLYLKSNYYSYFTGANITNVTIDGMNYSNGGDGIFIGGETGVSTLKNVTLTNFKITRCVNGIRFINFSGSTVVEESLFADGIITKCSGRGIVSVATVNNSNFRNMIISSCGSDGFTLSTGTNNSISGIKSINNVGVGFVLGSTGRLDVSDIFSNGNSGGSITYGSNVYTMGVTSLSGTVSGSSTAR